MNSWFVILIVGVPFLITGAFYAIVLRNVGRKRLLLTIAISYLFFNVVGPIWLSIEYLNLGSEAQEFWSAIAIVMICRTIELVFLGIGKDFSLSWRNDLNSAEKEENELMPPF